MRNFRIPIFWKILSWFWLSLIVIITINFFIGFYYSNKVRFETLPPQAEKDFYNLVVKVERLFESRNIQRIPNKQLRHFFFINSQGKDIFKRPLSPMLKELHEKAYQEGVLLLAWRKHEAFWGGYKIEYNGETLWLYSRQRPPKLSRHLLGRFFKDFAQSLLITIFLVSFPLSFFLSWIFTSPIRKLQSATIRLKQDLNNRGEIQALKKRTDEFGELAADFDDLAIYLSQRIEAQKQLISDVSHELRSPLTRLKIALGMIEDKLLEQGINVSRLQTETERMNEMLERLLSLSKLENLQPNFQKSAFNLTRLCESVIHDCQFEADQKQISIDSVLNGEVEFKGDQESLYSAIENLLRNAIKYTPDSGEIIFKLSAHDSQITIAIEDNGPGIPQDALQQIFTPFYRPQRDRARETGGVGLGLSIAKRAIELNGGRIALSNNIPHGLIAVITLGA